MRAVVLNFVTVNRNDVHGDGLQTLLQDREQHASTAVVRKGKAVASESPWHARKTRRIDDHCEEGLPPGQFANFVTDSTESDVHDDSLPDCQSHRSKSSCITVEDHHKQPRPGAATGHPFHGPPALWLVLSEGSRACQLSPGLHYMTWKDRPIAT
jgi:hypothetical protein